MSLSTPIPQQEKVLLPDLETGKRTKHVKLRFLYMKNLISSGLADQVRVNRGIAHIDQQDWSCDKHVPIVTEGLDSLTFNKIKTRTLFHCFP